MRSTKRYSNATFSKRVDYDGGIHRPPRAPSEPLVCGECGAVYVKRRWVAASRPGASALAAVARKTTCAACEAAATGVGRGTLRLEGAFVTGHRAELERLLQAEADRAAEDNPLGRIIAWDRSREDSVVVTTTTEHLAARLGRAVSHAYGGGIDFGFSHANKEAHAVWRRG